MTGYWLICLSLSNKFVVIPASSLGRDCYVKNCRVTTAGQMLKCWKLLLMSFLDYPVEYDVYFSGKELLMCSMQDKENYHLYIFDIEMPDMNGLELAKKCVKRDAKALFVFLTSYTRYVMEVFEVITFDYISKPITFEKIESVLFESHELSQYDKTGFCLFNSVKIISVSVVTIFCILKRKVGRLSFTLFQIPPQNKH